MRLSAPARILVLLVAASVPARAEPVGAPASPEPPGRDEEAAAEGSRRALATGAAVVPGVLLHGAGLYVAGDRRGAKRLLVAEGIGLGMAAAGGLTLGLTGASRKVAWPAAPLLVSGLGVMATTLLADLTGSSGLAGLGGPALRPAPVELRLGYAWVRDPIFDYDHLATAEAVFFVGPLRVEPSIWAAADADNQRYRGAVAWRALGATPSRRSRPGSWLDVELAATYHRYGDDGFSNRVGEASLGGRLDLVHVSPLLRGAFAELSTGLALEWIDYSGDDDDVFAMLLGTFGFGVRLGQPGGLYGEVGAYYDHRRDDYAAGIALPTRGSGFAGHVGGKTDVFLGDYGLSAEAWFGSAHIYQLAVIGRFGER